MSLDNDAFFKSWLKALNRKQLNALTAWQEERLSGSPSKEVLSDALDKKRKVYQEVRRRRDCTRA
ncbi:MAG: hypothetical protein KAS32_03220 [Candidatus Peribacteraceae bacterium]|nr:hypothetical protein [Candidatus Peribacteraceae bacterium]